MATKKLREASNLMNINSIYGVDFDNCRLLIHANNLKSLLSETETTSLVNGQLDTFMGFKIHKNGIVKIDADES